MIHHRSHSVMPIARPTRRRGFSFIELLFAVMLLGIGFIMIAGVFPVAILQTQATSNETIGTLVARDALRQIQAVASLTNGASYFPMTSTVSPNLNSTLTAAAAAVLGSNEYSTIDRRFGWVAFYRRPNAADAFAQVFVIVLQNPNFATSSYFGYGFPPIVPENDTFALTAAPTAPALPSVIPKNTVTLAYSASTGNSYAYISNTSGTSNLCPYAATGAYVLVANETTSSDRTGTQEAIVPTLIGRIYKLGPELGASPQLPPDVSPSYPTSAAPLPDCFQLEPGFDLMQPTTFTGTVTSPEQTGTASTLGTVTAYIIGRAPVVSAGTVNFTGANQDVAALSGFITINTATN